jgi:hypothetical protein
MGGFLKEATHVPLRSYRRPVGEDAILLPRLLPPRQAGRPWKDHRRAVNGILWHLHTGAPWPDTPERYGPWQTVYDRFNRWRKDGTYQKTEYQAKIDESRLRDGSAWTTYWQL